MTKFCQSAGVTWRSSDLDVGTLRGLTMFRLVFLRFSLVGRNPIDILVGENTLRRNFYLYRQDD